MRGISWLSEQLLASSTCTQQHSLHRPVTRCVRKEVLLLCSTQNFRSARRQSSCMSLNATLASEGLTSTQYYVTFSYFVPLYRDFCFSQKRFRPAEFWESGDQWRRHSCRRRGDSQHKNGVAESRTALGHSICDQSGVHIAVHSSWGTPQVGASACRLLNHTPHDPGLLQVPQLLTQVVYIVTAVA
jgi:hypothetical protein